MEVARGIAREIQRTLSLVPLAVLGILLGLWLSAALSGDGFTFQSPVSPVSPVAAVQQPAPVPTPRPEPPRPPTVGGLASTAPAPGSVPAGPSALAPQVAQPTRPTSPPPAPPVAVAPQNRPAPTVPAPFKPAPASQAPTVIPTVGSAASAPTPVRSAPATVSSIDLQSPAREIALNLQNSLLALGGLAFLSLGLVGSFFYWLRTH